MPSYPWADAKETMSEKDHAGQPRVENDRRGDFRSLKKGARMKNPPAAATQESLTNRRLFTPHLPRRTTRPGRAAVSAPFATTGTPFTSTQGIPSG